MSAMTADNDIPLCVDLDGTLLNSDVLFESFFLLIKARPIYAFYSIFWLLKGKANLKHQIACRVDLDAALLPYNRKFLEYLKEQHRFGRRLVLATASNAGLAHSIAAHLDIFEDVLASDEDTNLSGKKKLDRLVERYGEKGFDYAGNGHVDLPIWNAARNSILINTPKALAPKVQEKANVERIIGNDEGRLAVWVRALRLHQWLKNLLVFVPLAAAHQVGDFTLLFQAALAFLSFSLCASSVYILNDLLDLPSDRSHPRKRSRPLASGEIDIRLASLMSPVLLVASIGIALFLPIQFLAVLGLYYASTLAYSFWLKSKVLVDVLVLAMLYTIRILAGSAATQIEPSFWLLAFSMFLFLSLAMAKRYAEILPLKGSDTRKVKGRGYLAQDTLILSSMGPAAGYIAVLVLALYINSNDVVLHYHYPQAIWLMCPLLLYWVSRVWMLTSRGRMHDDPVVFAITDRVSRWVAMASVAILWLAI